MRVRHCPEADSDRKDVDTLCTGGYEIAVDAEWSRERCPVLEGGEMAESVAKARRWGCER